MLKDGMRGSGGRSRLRSVLVSAQIAMALVLLAGAGLLMRSFYEVLHVDAGFNPDHVMTMKVAPARVKYGGHADLQIQLARGIEQSIAALPGVRVAGIGTDLPLAGNPTFIMRFEGFPPVTPSQAPIAAYFAVTPGYFEALGMRLIRGRSITSHDDVNSPLVAVVNQRLVDRYFPGQNPIGRRLEIGFDDPPRWREIVGVVADVHSAGLDAEAPVQVFGAYQQIPTVFGAVPATLTVLARTAQDPASVAAAMHRAILQVDRSQPVFAIDPMTAIVGQSIAQRRLALILLAFFAVSAMTLAAVGVYGVMSFVVTQRTGEIGIRMALGADAWNVAWLVQRQGMVLVGAGLVIGTGAAFLLTRLLGKLLFHVGERDPLAFTAAALMLVLVSVAASWLPARRAARVDPLIALRIN
jgi:putative ABC transport system permease protein